MGLQEARLLMLNENLDAASAAHSVGYNNAAHFNRKVALSEQAERVGAWVRLDQDSITSRLKPNFMSLLCILPTLPCVNFNPSRLLRKVS
jgi:hypothetical protein